MNHVSKNIICNMDQSDYQKITLNSYEQSVNLYIEKTVSVVGGYHKIYIDRFLSFMNKSDIILEIGAGAGRDADYIDSLGYQVLRSDITEGFIVYNQAKQKDIISFDVLNDNLNRKFKNIIAMAVFLHFTDNDFRKALLNVHHHLEEGGIFACEIKNGEGEVWSEHKLELPRYFNYWNIDSVKKEVEELFDVVYIAVADQEKWIELILRKK